MTVALGTSESSAATSESNISTTLKQVGIGFMVATKTIGSMGFRAFSLMDFFFNQHYLLAGLWCVVPHYFLIAFVVYSTVADGMMNIFTRGVSMFEGMNGGQPEGGEGTADASILPDRNSTSVVKIGWYGVALAGLVSAICSSLSAFLGSITLIHLVTSCAPVVLVMACIVAVSNLYSNMTYRVKKALKHYKEEVAKKGGTLTAADHLWLIIASIGVIAFFGGCFYGTSHSIRLMVSLLTDYQGGPDSEMPSIAKYENIIYALTWITLPFSVVTYFFSSVLKMLSEVQDDKKNHSIDKTDKQAVAANPPRSIEEIDSKATLFARAKAYGLWINYKLTTSFWMWGEMIGTGLAALNSCNGLIVKTFFTAAHVFTTWQSVLINLLSLAIAAVSLCIYYKFNMPDWEKNSQEMSDNAINATATALA